MDLKKLPKTEFSAAIAQIAGERKIDAQLILDSIEDGLIAAYKRDQKEKNLEISEDSVFMVDLDADSGSFHVYDITNPDKKTDVTPPGFGRIAAQTAMQVINQRINEAERDTILSDFVRKSGSLVSGTVIKNDPYKLVVSLNQTEGICTRDEQIRGENLAVGTRKMFLVKGISEDANGKKEVLLSRKDPEFIRQLFMREVPEVGNKTVKIEKISRSAGDRTKVAVSTAQGNIDPVGSCIGQKGARIQAILNELPPHEKIDVVLFAKNLSQFIIQALSPARDVQVTEIDKEAKTALVTVPEDQLALAIGSEGSNVRLAGELVGGFEIKVVGQTA